MKIISGVDKDNCVAFKQKLVSLPLREEYVIAKSIEMFGDPEPCIIHKSAVIKKVYLEFEQYFDLLPGIKVNEIPVGEIPECIINSVDIDFSRIKSVIVETAY